MGTGKEVFFLVEKVGSITEADSGFLHPLGLTTTYLKIFFGSNASWGSCAEGSGDSLFIVPPQYMVHSNHCLAGAHKICVGMQVT